ncbi:MAG: M23 family metallopeptidase [Bacteroidales bacterium]
MLRNTLLYMLLPLATLTATAQAGPERTYQIPVKMQPFLSGNFAELRNNHFHSGIDFKTQGSTGHPIYSFDEGWVSRISVSPWGYGNALYISHHNGMTTVYAHLENFSPEIRRYVKDYQYEHETFIADIYPDKEDLPVKRGEIVAKSGNSGSSGGPHLHFEIRDTETQDPIDPLPYFINKVKDTTKPNLRNIRIYPIEGVVNGGNAPVTTNPVRKEDGSTVLNKTVTAWGKIGIGVKAYDRMDETTNIYGVKQVRLFVDDTLHFSMQHNRFAFADTRYLNSLIDYADWQSRRSMVMKLFIDPGNNLNCYRQAIDRGEITINEERPYRIRLELSDAHGNKKVFPFTIRGKRQEIPEPKQKGVCLFAYDQDNSYHTDSFSIVLPQGMLYTDLDFTYRTASSAKGFSKVHHVGDPLVPIHSYVDMKIALTSDPLSDKSKYYIASLRNGAPTYIGGEYENGTVKTAIRNFGSFIVMADTIAPVLSPVNPEGWGKTGTIRYRMSDGESGIKTWRGEVDGQFALFEHDGKSSVISYRIDTQKIGKGKKHTLSVVLTDKRGNEKRDERTFYW